MYANSNNSNNTKNRGGGKANNTKSTSDLPNRAYANQSPDTKVGTHSQNTSALGLLNKLDDSQYTDSLVAEVFGNDAGMLENKTGDGHGKKGGPVINTLK